MSVDEKKLALLTAEAKVTVLVGPDEQKFQLPKDLVCQKSSFFAKAFTGTFKEGIEGVCRLPEDDPTLFCTIAVWFYETKFDLEGTGDDSDLDEEKAYFHLRLRIYYLAHKLGIDLMCKQLISWPNHYWDGLNHSYRPGNSVEYHILPGLMQEICEKTSRNSDLRRMVLSSIAMFLFTSDRRGEEAETRKRYPLRNDIYHRYQEEVPSFASDLLDAILVHHSPSNALNRAQLLGKRKRPQE